MIVFIVGVILLLIIFFTFRYIKRLSREEEELESIDRYAEKMGLLDRSITLLDRKEVIDSKINKIKERTTQNDDK